MAQWLQKMRHSALVRGRLIEVATELARQHGLASITTRRIAALSGLSTGAVQHHFPSIETLRGAVLEHWCSQVGALILGPARQETYGIGFVWAVSEGWLAWSEAIPVPFHALSPPGAAYLTVVDALAADWFDRTRAALHRARALGEVDAATDPIALAIEIHALLWSTSWGWATTERATFLTITAKRIHGLLLARATNPLLLPDLEERLAMILQVSARLAKPRPRPDPHDADVQRAAGLPRRSYEDVVHPDSLERLEWEERCGLPTRSRPLCSSPDWWSRVMEPFPATPAAPAPADTDGGESLTPEEKATLDRAFGLAPREQPPTRTYTPEERAEFERLMAEQRARGEEERRQDAESCARAEALRNAR